MRQTFFDTNVLVYLFDNRDPEKKIRAQQVFAEESESTVVAKPRRRENRRSG